MIKTYNIKHNLNLGALFSDYKVLLNQYILEIWSRITWETKSIQKKQSVLWTHLPYTQHRIIPHIPTKADIDKELRRKYVEHWHYSTHWVNSAMDTAWSIIHSWYENYKNGHRKRTMPVVTREFMRIKQTLFRWDGQNTLQISIYPHQFQYIDLSTHWFPFGTKLGEPIITPTEIHLPFYYSDPPKNESKIAWDSNFHSLDGYSPQTGWVKVDIKPLHTIHDTYHDKYRHINQVYAKNKHKGKLLYAKYKSRERHRVNDYLHRVANAMIPLASTHGFESLEKWRMVKKSRNFNRKLSDTDWRKIVRYIATNSNIQYIEPYYTSKTCSQCGYVHKDLTSEHELHCRGCGIIIDRQYNASRNLYQRMNGVTLHKAIYEGEIPAIGAETSVSDELARIHEELMMPKQTICVPLKYNGT